MMSKLLKHLGFGGKKNHKTNYNGHKSSTIHSDNSLGTSDSQKNSDTVAISSTCQDYNNDIARKQGNDKSKDILHSTRRLPAQHINDITHESLNSKSVKSDSISKSKHNHRETKECKHDIHNNDSGLRQGSKITKTQELREQVY